ncbi:hypothetical protein [Mycolicibacterium wolinskyi]|uniref:hypothetical protein n=1 Tax=Mycolicibacterium wolinskyi TaxID=59750 RepID=UPI001F3033B5|nr:hypothetical protein [Mycolicibacterium wolinskyi]
MTAFEPHRAAASARRRTLADRRWKAFCAALGYPDPDTITQERTIWQASDAHMRVQTSPICSASSTGKVAVTSPEIRQIVRNVYDQHLPLPQEWTASQREQFMEAEASRISRQVADLAAQMGEQAVQHWQNHHGQPPDYLTKVGLLNNAHSQAMETVLSTELYEQIPPTEDDNQAATETSPDRSQVPWDQRWTNTQYRSDPSEQIEALVATIWSAPDFSAVFRIKAGYLLAARVEDQLRLPTHRHDPLAATLADLVYRDLRHDGLPER